MSDNESKRQALDYLLGQSSIYAQIIGDKLERERASRANAEEKANKKVQQQQEQPPPEAAAQQPDAPARTTRRAGKAQPPQNTAKSTNKKGRAAAAENKRKRDKNDLAEVMSQQEVASPAKRSKGLAGDRQDKSEPAAAAAAQTQDEAQQQESTQPALVTGATLKDYQMQGVEWMISLFSNGLSGILADEMGLGKTIQTIAFLAHLYEHGLTGPFLVVCPLSTLANWISEFERFTPDIPVLLYHGSPADRATMREERLGLPSANRGGKRVSTSGPPKGKKLPVIVTTYELVINDRAHLSKIAFKYIVVDESHRLKNLNCKLIRELKKYESANRLLLTGTPLQNSLPELWSLLNFVLPQIFDDLDSFQQWFDFTDLDSEGGHNRIISQEQSNQVITKLHAILKPFLLRRLKNEVEKDLPPKKEYLLYAPLTHQQKELYEAIVGKSIRSLLIDRKTSGSSNAGSSREATPLSTPSSPGGSVGSGNTTSTKPASRRSKRKSYLEKSDEQFFDDLDNGELDQEAEEDDDLKQRGQAYERKRAVKSVNGLKLQNLVMQLRKVCNHPWLFDWPVNNGTGELVINEDLINASGKMLMLNQLLNALFDRGHKVLLFSQFTSMLDIIQDWAQEYKGWNICRLDGTTKQEDRLAQMKEFNEDNSDDAPRLFLLSTRAGGVGITLTAADTVILFDSDFNPQQDLQAQDRAHRIGQTKPVLVFRLISSNTIESHILARAASKRKLEQLVIGEGKFNIAAVNQLMGKGGDSKGDKESLSNLAGVLLGSEGERIELAHKDDEIISPEQLERLLDRSPEAMSREKGWGSSEKKAFEVFETMESHSADASEAVSTVKAKPSHDSPSPSSSEN